eukprot:143355-Alexandrium_andersonii.AAC.1
MGQDKLPKMGTSEICAGKMRTDAPVFAMPEVVHVPSAACKAEVDAALPRSSWRRIPAAGRALAG